VLSGNVANELLDDDGLAAVGNLLYRDVGLPLRAGERVWRVEWTSH